MRVLFLTHRGPHEVLSAARGLGADLKAEPPTLDALARLPDLAPDLLVADAVVDPDACFDLLSALRAAGNPVGVVAVLDEQSLDRHPWHEVADDFIRPQASQTELRLRLGLLANRRGETGEAVIRLGPVAINVETYRVTVGGHPLDLTYKEFELLRYLAERPGRVFTRAQLLQEVWGYDFYGGTRTVDVHIRRLRAKLGPEREHLIETVRGVGYRGASEG